MMRSSLVLLVTAAGLSCTNAFVARPSVSRLASTGKEQSSALHFGVPTFGGKDSDSDTKDKDEKKIGWSGLVQLITAGAGSPFLGDFEGIDEETGKMMFSLEANNLVDENGESKQTQMPYFESGWVDEEEEARGFKFPWQK